MSRNLGNRSPFSTGVDIVPEGGINVNLPALMHFPSLKDFLIILVFLPTGVAKFQLLHQNITDMFTEPLKKLDKRSKLMEQPQRTKRQQSAVRTSSEQEY